MKTVEELKKLDLEKLKSELEQAEKDYFKVRFEVANIKAKNNHEVKRKRHYIARIKTILNV